MKFFFRTRIGTFYIAQDPQNARWVIFYENESLGSYYTPSQAAEDLAGGHTYTPSCGDTSRLGIPADIGDWERMW